MGIRCTQYIGLNPWAREFVDGDTILLYTEEVVRVYPDGRREKDEPRPVFDQSVTMAESGEHATGMFDEKIELYKYTFPDGKIYFERVQASPWSSGPCIFTALQDKKGSWVPESLWSEKQITAA